MSNVRLNGIAIGLLLTFFLMLGCSHNSDQNFQNRLQHVKAKVKTAEQEFGENDPTAKDDVKRWLSKLADIERMALETSESDASKKLDDIQQELALILEHRENDLQIKSFSGRVSLGGKSAVEKMPLVEGQFLKVGVDSRAEITLFIDSHVSLLPDTTLKINQIQPWSRSFSGELLKGGIIYQQRGTRSKFHLLTGGREFDKKEEGAFEVHLTGHNRGFVVPKKGNIIVTFEEKREKVQFGEGFTWNGIQSEHIQPLQAPEILSPKPEKTFLSKSDEKEILVDFEWVSVDQADTYSIDIYSDKEIKKPWKTGIIVQSTNYSFKFPKGVFFWQVKAINKDKFPGYNSKIQWFSVVTEQSETVISKAGPKLTNMKIQVMNDMAIVTGKVTNQASITVNQTRAVSSIDGSFEVIVNLQMGEQWITVVATGRNGGQTIEKYKVNPDF